MRQEEIQDGGAGRLPASPTTRIATQAADPGRRNQQSTHVVSSPTPLPVVIMALLCLDTRPQVPPPKDDPLT